MEEKDLNNEDNKKETNEESVVNEEKEDTSVTLDNDVTNDSTTDNDEVKEDNVDTTLQNDDNVALEESKKDSVEPEKTNNKENITDTQVKSSSTVKEKLSSIKNNNMIKKIAIIVVVALILLLGIRAVYNKLNNNDSISGVKKILSAKYTSITTVDNGFMAIDGDKNGKYKVYLYSSKGKKVAQYKEDLTDAKNKELPIEISDSYYISATVSLSGLETSKYSIRNSRGKSLFDTKNELSVINDNLILMENDDKEYILNTKGEKLYSKISNMNTYLNGEYITFKENDTSYILDFEGNKVLTNYEIRTVVTDEDNNGLYMILRNTEDKAYNYYSLSKNEIIGDSFNNYYASENDYEYIISKEENNDTVKYVLKKDGTQEKKETTSEMLKTIKEKIDTDKYTIYDDSIYSSDQEDILVSNDDEKSIGILNIDKNKYTKLYSYKENKTYSYSTVSTIDSKVDDTILKISCSESSCDSKTTVIYDIRNNKELYRSDGINVSDYKEYDDGYKVVSFSSDRENEYGSKNVVFNKNNKELEVLEDDIVIVDKDLVYGEESTYSLYLYSTKEGKIINETAVRMEKINDSVVYKYTDSDNTVILNSDGEEIIKISSDDYIVSSDNYYVYIKDNVVYTYNVDKKKAYKYKLKDNEKINDASGDTISPYKQSIIVNNSTDKYVKILNFKGNQIKKISGVEVSSVKYNKTDGKIFIIVKSNSKSGSFYGLYVAE